MSEPINIRQVGNGYIITPQVGQAMCVSDDSTMVFNHMTDLQKWMEDYFENSIDLLDQQD